MGNSLKFGEYDAVINFDPQINMFRGEFVGLNGSVDFYADNIEKLRHEGEISMKLFLDFAKEKNIQPKKPLSGKLVLRLKPDIHRKYKLLASSRNISLNKLLNDTLEKAV